MQTKNSQDEANQCAATSTHGNMSTTCNCSLVTGDFKTSPYNAQEQQATIEPFGGVAYVRLMVVMHRPICIGRGYP